MEHCYKHGTKYTGTCPTCVKELCFPGKEVVFNAGYHDTIMYTPDCASKCAYNAGAKLRREHEKDGLLTFKKLEEMFNNQKFLEFMSERGLKPADLTCCSCNFMDCCEFSFDPYNTNGDCLAIK